MPTITEVQEIQAARLVSLMIEEDEFCESLKQNFPLTEILPDRPAEQLSRIEDLIRESASSVLNEMSISMARYLPAEDVSAFIALFHSDLGRRWLEGTRKIQADLADKVRAKQNLLRREIDRILSEPGEC